MLRKFALMLFCAPLALGQTPSPVSVTASHITDAANKRLAGKLCFAPVDVNNTPQGFRVGTQQVVPGETCGAVAAGALQNGYTVPPLAAGLGYHVYFKANYSNAVIRDYGFVLSDKFIDGGSFSLDTYDPATVTHFAGPKGDKGDKGDTGPQGPTGGLAYAAQYPGQTNNGIVSSFADSVRCGPSGSGGVGGCTVVADPTYPVTEQPYTWMTKTPPAALSHYIDRRKGYQLDIIHDPTVNSYTGRGDFFIDSCINTSQLGYTGGATGWQGTKNNCRSVQFLFAAPGGNYGTPGKGPGGWTSQTGLYIEGYTNTPGIEEGLGLFNFKYGIGDTTNYITHWSYGGAVAGSDEGSHTFSTGGGEGQTTYTGTIATGGTGATTIKVSCATDCNGPGDGRYDINVTKASSTNYVLTHTAPSGFVPGKFGTVNAVTPSTFWGTLAADVITPTGTPIGKGSTDMTMTLNSGPGNSGSPSVGDLVCFAGQFHEQSKLTSVTGSGPWTVHAPLRHAHESGSWVVANGPCGTFINFPANDAVGSGPTLRFPVDILGATDDHTLLYRFFYATGASTAFPFGNVVLPNNNSGTMTNTGGVVTIPGFTVANAGLPFFNQTTLTISNAANPDFNGACTNSTSTTDFAAGLKLTCTQASSTGETSVGAFTIGVGSSPYSNTAFNLYPGAELLDMLEYDAATCLVASLTAPCNVGTHTLEPNNVAWTAGDAVENAHHYAANTGAMRQYVTLYNPYVQGQPGRTLQLIGNAGGGQVGGGMTNNHAGDVIYNYAPVSNFAYHGGTRTPVGGYTLSGAGGGPTGGGIFAYGLAMTYAPDPPGSPVLYVGCPYSGCTDAAFYYNPLRLTGNGGDALLQFIPYNRSLSLTAGWLDLFNAPIMSPKIQGRANGQSASLVFNSYDSGAALHAWTITAPTTGGGYTLTLPQKTGTFATTGDLAATMVASGASHAGGLVPDPGASAGTSKYLREDATWQTIAQPSVFGASGSGHSTGLVPDPGASAGTIKFLREDGTWQTPAGGGVSANNTPVWLKYLGTGDNGVLNITSGTTNVYGDNYYTSVNISAGATLKVTQAQGLVIHSTGTCTINGTVDARAVSASTSTAVNGTGAAGTGGGGGGGTGAGTAGKAAFAFTGQGSGWPGGSGGTASGGAGGNGTTFATTSSQAHLAVASAGTSDGNSQWGGAGGAGANSGGAAGAAGASVVFICESIAGTGVIDVSGAYGSPAVGNSTGAGGGGAGGTIILSSHQPVTYGLTYYTSGGPGSLAGTVGYPEALWTSGTATSPAKATLGVSGGALDGTCTVQQAGAGYGTGTGAVVNVLGGGGTLGTGVVNAVWSGGALQSCTVTPGTSSGYTATTYTNSGAGGDGGNGIVFTFNGW